MLFNQYNILSMQQFTRMSSLLCMRNKNVKTKQKSTRKLKYFIHLRTSSKACEILSMTFVIQISC